MLRRPALFVGSSKEGIEIAEAVQLELQDLADVTIWTQGIFEVGRSYLESLTKTIERADFAVLVLTPDDIIESRGSVALAPRDNVLFELGLFMGRLGRERCLFVYDKTSNVKLLSDLFGIAGATYQLHQSGNIPRNFE